MSVRSSQLLLALLPIVLALPACFDLQKVDPGPRFIDDFEDGGTPTWSRFAPWTCDIFTSGGGRDAGRDTDGGADGGLPDVPAVPDGGPTSTCKLSFDPTGDGDRHALRSDFTLVDPADGIRQFPNTEIVTRTTSSTVDVTGFTQLVFSAILESAPQMALPAATQFQIGLGCSTFKNDPLATQTVGITLGAGWAEFRLRLDGFGLKNMTRNQSCLALVDSIRFRVLPGLADGASTGGALHIDNISLQN